jgi:Protein of unknown function (DUF3551)
MIAIRLRAAMIWAVATFAANPAAAQYSPWCAVYTGETGSNCAFATREQCASVAGIKGTCIPNSGPAPIATPASVAVRRVRTEPDTRPAHFKPAPPKSGSSIGRTVSTGVSNNPPVRHALPAPDPALLRSLPDFNCEFKTNSADASVPPQSNPPRDQADPGAAGALQMKLDYERQCYRHAAMIAHDRLRDLQASVGETIKLIDVGARSSVPLPDRALLAQPAEFDCEFKTATLDNAGGAPQTSGQASSGAEGALRTKLDYERQCYQHAEMISRDRLRHLQAAAGEMLKAARRNGHPAGRRKL